MSLKRDNLVRQENSKPSVFAKLKIARKNTKIFSEYRKREAKINSDCYFLAFIFVYMHSFNFIKILSFDITNRYFHCFVNWLLLSWFLVIVFVSHTCFLLQKVFLFISSSGFKLFEVLRLYFILSTFLSILCVQGTTLIKQCSKVSTKTFH